MADISLFYKNQNLVHSIVHKRFYNHPDKEDITQVGFIGLYKAAKSFNPSKSKFSTYATYCITNEIFAFIKKNKKNKVEYLDERSIIDYRAPDYEVRLEDMFPWITDKEMEILKMRLNRMKCSEIAKKYNCSKQRISYIIRSIYQQWKSQKS
jgi:RNA polymerase sigma factor (sigma-70 family)